MARTARITYDGVVYHIMQRGNNKQRIFKDNDDFATFCGLLKQYKHRYRVELYSYCLMPNHVHLLIKFLHEKEIAKFFQGLFQSFQFHHRRKYAYAGILYQNRYKSIPVEKDSYLLECSRYIERNPLRNKAMESLNNYRWSSYLCYATGKTDSLITPNPMYIDLAKTPKKRMRLYREYLAQEGPYEELLDQKIEKLR